MRLDIPLALAALAGVAAGQEERTCFVPNGTARHLIDNGVKDTYRPCSSEGHSMCCNKGPADECRDNGLCYNPKMGYLWRESCTDSTWESPKCLKLCIDDEAATGKIPSSQMDVRIKICPDLSFCCGADNDPVAIACCNAEIGKRIVDGQVVDASASTSAPSAGSQGSINMGVVGGSVAGAFVAGVLALAAGFYWYKRRKRALDAAAVRNKSMASETAQYRRAPAELPPDSFPPAELPPDACPRAEAPS